MIISLQQEIISIKNREFDIKEKIEEVIDKVNELNTETAYDEGSAIEKSELKPVPEKIIEKPQHVSLEEEHLKLYC